MNIATQDFVVKNQPIECISTLSHRMRLTIGKTPSDDDVFKGIVSPNGNLSAAIDVQPFVYDLVDSSGIDIAFTAKYADYNGMVENINIKMVKDVVQNATTHFTKSQLTLVNKNLTFDEWFKFNSRQNFGFFEQFWLNRKPTDTDWLAWSVGGRFYDDPFPHNFYTYGSAYDIGGGINNKSRRWKKSLMGAPIFLTLFHLNTTGGSYEISFNNVPSKESRVENYIGRIGNLSYNASSGSYRNYRLDKYLINEKLFSINIKQPNVRSTKRMIWYERVDASCLKGEAFQLYWINRRGGIDSQLMEGKSYKSNSIKRENFTVNKRKLSPEGYVGKSSDVLNRNILTTTKRSYALNSGIIDEYEYAGIEDLMYSPSVWIWNNNDKRMMPVRVVDTNYDFKNFNNDKAFNFSVQLEDELTTNIL